MSYNYHLKNNNYNFVVFVYYFKVLSSRTMSKAKLYPPIEVIKKRKPEPTDGERKLLSFLMNNLNDEYEIFYQPFLNGDLPDIVLMRKDGGLILFEVKDWNLDNYIISSDGKWVVKSNGAVNRKSPFSQVLKYKENLYNLHVDSLLELKLKDFKYWYIVSCAVYFHCHDEKVANQVCYGISPNSKYKTFLDKNFKVFDNYCKNCRKFLQYTDWVNEKCIHCKSEQQYQTLILGKDSLNKYTFDKIFKLTWISKNSKFFTTELYDSFCRILKPSIHTIEEGTEIVFSQIQKELSISEEGVKKRIKGVAGSGKSLVLARRAINAHIRTNSIVLILTYNITLRNYIRDKLSSIRENFLWDFFHICNYHDFINSNMNNVGIGFDFLEKNDEGNIVYNSMNEEIFDEKVYSNINLFKDFKDDLPKYDAIFIDETQDYKENWIRIIKEYFTKEQTEIVAFADEKQNIYSRDLDNNKMPIIPLTVGAWDKRLNISYRLSNKIASLAFDFQKVFFKNKYELENKIDTTYKPMLFDNPIIEYHFLDVIDDESISKYIYNQILKHKFNSNDVTILSSRIKMLRELNEYLKLISKEKTNIMFETKEEYESLSSVSSNGYDKNKEIEKVRKNRKANFWMNRGTFKLSTIHSFKGWESPVLFLIIENNIKSDDILSMTDNKGFKPQEFSDELVYTGITRCKDFLFIINLNNIPYDNFFRNNSLVDVIK